MLTKDLQRAFRELTPIAPSESELRSHDAALGCVRIVCDGKQTTIAAYNLNGTWKRITLPPEPWTFEVLCPFYLVKKWLRVVARSCKEVWIRAIATGIEFTGDTFTYRFNAPGVDRYPVMPDERRSRAIDSVVRFIRPVRIHPEAGKLEPETSEAFCQLCWQLSEEPIMPEYAIDLEEMKQAVVISMRPDEAFEIVCGGVLSILVTDLDEENFDLKDRYCVVHAATVEGKVLEDCLVAIEGMEIDPSDAPPGMILGYVKIDGYRKYENQDEWLAGYDAGYHPYLSSFGQMQDVLGVTGALYGVSVEQPIILMNYVPMQTPISAGFWKPEHPFHTSAVRKAFEVENVGVDVDREIRLPGLLKG